MIELKLTTKEEVFWWLTDMLSLGAFVNVEH